MATQQTIAIIGAGEMGAAVGNRLRENGARVITTLAGRSAASVERVRRAQLEVVDDDDLLAREAAFILSIVPPGQAAAVADRYRDPITRAAGKPIFVECNAVSPTTACAIAQALAPAGCGFTDAGIIGGPPPAGRIDAGPRIYASGEHAASLAALREYRLDVAILDGPVGAASALKMSYAGLTKGLIAIGAAMLGGAARAGVAPALRAELERSQPQLLKMLGARVPAMFPKAYRWVAEMEQIAEFLGAPGDGATIYEGAARLYERVAAQWQRDGEGAASFTALRSFIDDKPA
jgi:3-hydroxyisobutyrate dehydrogenase-like beta-hydroxyacid dehydrogenase